MFVINLTFKRHPHGISGSERVLGAAPVEAALCLDLLLQLVDDEELLPQLFILRRQLTPFVQGSIVLKDYIAQ